MTDRIISAKRNRDLLRLVVADVSGLSDADSSAAHHTMRARSRIMQATPQRHRQLASLREISRTYDDSLGGRLMPARPSLAEPVMVARFWANRRGEAIVIQLREFEGRALVDVRKYFFSIVPGVGPHVAQLVCDSCNRGGRWLSQNHFGAPA